MQNHIDTIQSRNQIFPATKITIANFNPTPDGGQVIPMAIRSFQNPDLMPILKQSAYRMRADKAGPSQNQTVHESSS